MWAKYVGWQFSGLKKSSGVLNTHTRARLVRRSLKNKSYILSVPSEGFHTERACWVKAVCSVRYWQFTPKRGRSLRTHVTARIVGVCWRSCVQVEARLAA